MMMVKDENLLNVIQVFSFIHTRSSFSPEYEAFQNDFSLADK